MNRFVLCLFMVMQSVLSTLAQEPLELKLLNYTPSIDGQPDDKVVWQNFPVVEKSSRQNEDVKAKYMMAYTLDYLYLIIEYDAGTIISRDRAYQNGDGLHMVIAKADSNKRSKEFYVLRFSPPNKADNRAATKAVWYYNIDLSSKPLSTNTIFSCNSSNEKSYLELLIPWQDIYPYHPLFTKEIGINLCFVKAIGKAERNYYYIKEDPYIQWELKDRDYLPVKFEGLDSSFTFDFTKARLSRLNANLKDSLYLQVVTNVAIDSKVNFAFSIKSVDNYSYINNAITLDLKKGINKHSIGITHNTLRPGGYIVKWRNSLDFEGEMPFTILPDINYETEFNNLNKLRSNISAGDFNTVHFMLKNITSDLGKIKSYELAGGIRERFTRYKEILEELKTDSFARKPGIYRRSFLSTIDSTLQPYTIKIPSSYNPTKNYPLLVMLHGSGSDDQDMLNNTLTDGNFIEIAPYGRGTSNCFTTDHAEIDVREAIQDVIDNYPIDRERLIIAGFSMGGYGAYRIFYEYPSLFKGVSVFAGHPNLANKWIGEGHPDFLVDKYLAPFKNKPVFIYHSKNDLNCPYELTHDLISKLEKAGAKVEVVTVENSGHGIIDKENISIFHNWLRSVIQ